MDTLGSYSCFNFQLLVLNYWPIVSSTCCLNESHAKDHEPSNGAFGTGDQYVMAAHTHRKTLFGRKDSDNYGERKRERMIEHFEFLNSKAKLPQIFPNCHRVTSGCLKCNRRLGAGDAGAARVLGGRAMAGRAFMLHESLPPSTPPKSLAEIVEASKHTLPLPVRATDFLNLNLSEAFVFHVFQGIIFVASEAIRLLSGGMLIHVALVSSISSLILSLQNISTKKQEQTQTYTIYMTDPCDWAKIPPNRHIQKRAVI